MYNPNNVNDVISRTDKVNTNAKTDANSDKLYLYINDARYKEHYSNKVVVPSNVYDALGNENEHAQKYINAFNVVDFIAGFGLGNDSIDWKYTSNDFGNWRDITGIKVNKHVILRPDDVKVQFKSSQKFEPLWDKVMGNGAVSSISKMAEAARMFDAAVNQHNNNEEVSIPMYKKVPVLSDIEPLSLPSSLKFNFQFGQAGLFSAEEEVVKPILAIAKFYMADYSGTANWVKGNGPSTEYALGEAVKRIGSRLIGSDGGLKDSYKTSTGDDSNESGSNGSLFGNMTSAVAKTLTGVQNVLLSAVNDTAKSLVVGGSGKKSMYKSITYRIGRMTLPSMLVKDVSFDFDFTTVDEYGFPYKGSVILDGLESMVTAYAGQIKY